MLLERLEKICLALDGAACERSESHATFRAKKKVFAYFLDNHHGDGIVAVACKVGAGDHEALVRAQPERFCKPAYICSRGWVSLRLDRGKVDWGEVKEFVGESYRLTAGKKAAPKRRPSAR